MQFHQRRHVQVEDLPVEAPQQAVIEAFRDQEHGIGAVRPRLEYLVAVDDELLPQHGQRHGHPRRLEIDEAAAKPDGVGEHGERRRTCRRIAADDLLDGFTGTEFTSRRALPLEFGDESDRPGGRHRRKEIADRRRDREPALEGHRRHAFARNCDFAVLPGHDLVEEGRHGEVIWLRGLTLRKTDVFGAILSQIS